MAGNITIITPKDNYLKVPKSIIFSDDVDALTLGIYVKVLCLGRKWELNVHGLANNLDLSVAKIKSSFAKLEKTGYLRRKRVKGAAGRFVGWDYEISSEPLTDISKNRPSESADVGKNRRSENGGDINRDYKEDRDIIDNNNRDNNIKHPDRKAVADFVSTLGFADPEGFADHYVSHNDNRGWIANNGKPIKGWKNNIRNNCQWAKDKVFQKDDAQQSTTTGYKLI